MPAWATAEAALSARAQPPPGLKLRLSLKLSLTPRPPSPCVRPRRWYLTVLTVLAIAKLTKPLVELSEKWTQTSLSLSETLSHCHCSLFLSILVLSISISISVFLYTCSSLQSLFNLHTLHSSRPRSLSPLLGKNNENLENEPQN